MKKQLLAISIALAALSLGQLPGAALEPQEIAARAREFTVRIDGPETGSGVIIDRDGDTYTVLTNWHVIDTPGTYELVTDDGREYRVGYDRVKYLPDIDLAVLEFESDRKYTTAKIGDSDDMTEGASIYLIGWADPIPGIPERSYQFLAASIVSRLRNSEDGYGILHDNPTTPGTSGGPVLNSKARLVGINGQFVSEGNTGRVFGKGIPMQTFLSARSRLVLPEGVEAPQDFVSQGDRLAKAGNYREAIVEFDRALEVDPNNIDALYKRGEAYYELEDYSPALADFKEVLRLNPNNSLVYIYRGYIYRDRLREYEKAIADFNQAISLNPNDAVAYNNRGVVYGRMGELDKAIADYNQAIRLNPNLVEAYGNRGGAYYRRGELDKAIADLSQFIRFNQNNFRVYNNRGAAYYGRGELDKAIADFTEVIRLNPDFAVAYKNRGVAYYDRGELDKAIADFTEVIRLEPNNFEAYQNRGIAYRMQKELDKAIADFNEVIRLNPNFADTYYELGLIYRAMGNKQTALANFEKAAQLYRKEGNTEWYQDAQQKIRELQ